MFRYKTRRLKGDWVKLKPTFSFPVTLFKGWIKCPSHFYVPDLRPNLLYTSVVGQLGSLGVYGLSGKKKERTTVKYKTCQLLSEPHKEIRKTRTCRFAIRIKLRCQTKILEGNTSYKMANFATLT